jgi:hypothetical protein
MVAQLERDGELLVEIDDNYYRIIKETATPDSGSKPLDEVRKEAIEGFVAWYDIVRLKELDRDERDAYCLIKSNLVKEYIIAKDNLNMNF